MDRAILTEEIPNSIQWHTHSFPLMPVTIIDGNHRISVDSELFAEEFGVLELPWFESAAASILRRSLNNAWIAFDASPAPVQYLQWRLLRIEERADKIWQVNLAMTTAELLGQSSTYGSSRGTAALQYIHDVMRYASNPRAPDSTGKTFNDGSKWQSQLANKMTELTVQVGDFYSNARTIFTPLKKGRLVSGSMPMVDPAEVQKQLTKLPLKEGGWMIRFFFHRYSSGHTASNSDPRSTATTAGTPIRALDRRSRGPDLPPSSCDSSTA